MAACVGVLLFIIMSFQDVFSGFIAAAQAFVPLSNILLLGIIVEGISFPVCAYFWGLKGLLVMALIGASLRALLFFFSARFLRLRVQFRIFGSTLKKLLSFGFFIKLVDYPNSFFVMASILWVTRFMTIEELALFSMARGFFMQVADISTRVSTVYSMRFLEQSGSGVVSRDVIGRQLKQFLLFQLLVAVPLLSWAAGVVLPFIVGSFIPKYSEGNQSLLILLTCCFFYVVNSGLTYQWVFEKRLIARGVANLFGLAAMVVSLAYVWFVLDEKTINGMACATLAGYFMYFVYIVLAVGKDFWRVGECLETIIAVVFAAGWTYFLLDIGHVSLVEQIEFTERLRATVFMGVWTLIALLPVPLYGLKKSGVLKGWQG